MPSATSFQKNQESDNGQAVTVIGRGPMGSSIINAFLDNKRPVTAWSRSLSTDQEQIGAWETAGVAIAKTLREAIDASDMIIVSIATYKVGAELFHNEEIAARLKGKSLIILNSGTPEDAEQEAKFWEGRDVNFLSGMILGYPPSINTPRGTIIYSGPRAVFDAAKPVLLNLGGNPSFVGEKIGDAAVLDIATIMTFTVGVEVALLEGAALCEANGIKRSDYFKVIFDSVLPDFAGETLRSSEKMIADGKYDAGLAGLGSWDASTKSAVAAFNNSGLDTSYISAMRSYILRARAAGMTRADELPAIYEVMRQKKA